jgi:hypothetical protein
LLPLLAQPLLGGARATAEVLAELRTVIDWLLASGALQLEWLPAEVVAA